jgi:carbonic anhydrase
MTLLTLFYTPQLSSFAMHIFSLVSVLAAISCVLANPLHRQQQREIRTMGSEQSAKVVARETSSDLELLSTGNQAFRDNIAATDPGLLQKLADEGQCMSCLPSKISCWILI